MSNTMDVNKLTRDEIEITPEMIEAGAAHLWFYESGRGDAADTVRDILKDVLANHRIQFLPSPPKALSHD